MGVPSAPLLVVASALLVGAGCAHSTTEGGHFGRDQWARAVAKRGVAVDQAVYPFGSTPEMDAWVAEALRTYLTLGSTGQLEALQTALFAKSFHFSYAEDVTLTAEQAFTERRGNCMSFTALFVALSRSAGIPTFLMTVRRTPDVDKEEDLVVVNRHVVAGYRSSSEVNVFDFYVTSAAPFLQERMVDDVMASAMYHNNLGGAAIRRGDLASAARDLEIATALAPDWAPGWVNLGVARFRSGDFDGAFAAYQRALEAEPNNSSAYTNLAFSYRQLGRHEEAEAALRAAGLRTSNPFTLIALADTEIARGSYSRAARHLHKAKRWYGTEPEVFEALARLERRRGDAEAADRYAKRAERLRQRQAAAD